MSTSVEFVGRRRRLWLFGAVLSVVTFGALCIIVPFEEDFSWGIELLFGVFLAGSVAWLAYVLLAPPMRLTISPETVICTSRLAPVRIDRSTGDLLVLEEVLVGAGMYAPTTSIKYWKMCPSGSHRGVLLSQWDPDVVVDACRSNGWQIEWRDRKGNLLDAPG